MNTDSPEALLQVQALCCERGYRQLFSGLNFSISPGQVIRIAGPNGAGKSTLLAVLAGLSSDYAGSIIFQGQALEQVSFEYRQQLAFLGHAKAVKTALSPRQNLAWFSAMYPTRADKTIDGVLAEMHLQRFADQPCVQLSAGQKQRVALARLLLSAASLWILDEPFTAIDQQGVEEFEEKIGQFVQQGGAVLITTHHSLKMDGDFQSLDIGEFA